MKKNPFIMVILLIFAMVLFGCKEKTVNEAPGAAKPVSSVNQSKSVFQTNNRVAVDFSSMTEFFSPDYSAVQLNNSSSEKVSTGSSSGSKKNGQKSESVIPGLRKLGDYKTKYNTEKPQLASSSDNLEEENLEAEISGADKTSFSIENWGPQNAVVAENENPTFFVMFSQPVHRIQALDAPSSVSDIMSVEPALKGVFRWYGSKMLAFEAQEPADPAQKYTISVKSGIKALSGATLTGVTVFTTKADAVKIERFYGGYVEDSDYASWSLGAVPPYDKRFYIRLNYPVTKEIIEDLLTVKIKNQLRTFSAEPDYDKEHFSWGQPLKADKEKNKSNSFIVTINGNIPFNSVVDVNIQGQNSYSYNTLRAFHVTDIDNYTSASTGTKKNPLHIRFNIPVDASSVLGNIYYDRDYTNAISADNFSVDGSTITIYNLPFEKNELHTITIQKGLKDIYGQNIDLHSYRGNTAGAFKDTYSFTVAAPPAYTKFLDYGMKIMEAQFPHRLLFEYQNAYSGRYLVKPVTNPFNSNYDSSIPESDYTDLPDYTEDVPHFVEMDLNPLLNDGYGFVKFQADVTRPYYDYWREEWNETTDTNALTVQVTDLGVTARVGINKAVVLVTSMETGKPISGAKVELFGKVGHTAEDIASEPYAQGTTDKDGLAVINYTEAEYEKLKSYLTYLGYSAPIVKVSYGKDKVMFTPSGHWTYNEVDRESYSAAVTPKQRTFMFVDRGLYRPGETVTFRGIDRSQLLGLLIVNRGDYKIKIVENTWDGKEICEPLTGTLSESGGFYGSFKLPDNLDPGSYAIKYVRADGKEENYFSPYGENQISFTVAEFERLKYEVKVSVPEITYYGGDSVSAEVAANYLSGGALSDADYKATWYYQPVEYTTNIPEAAGFTFGPSVYYSYRNYYSDESGSLGSNGTANMICKTQKITDGKAYRYRVSSDITDISNQRVSASNSVMVHPASYYVGLKRAGNGFAQKGKKIDINYLLVKPEGSLLEDTSLSLARVKDLEYKLTHTEWKYVNEQSVSNSIYTRYTREEVEDATGKIDVKASKGTFSVLPQVAGWYTLTVTGHDSKDNYVETSLRFYASGAGAFWGNNSEGLTLTTSQTMYNPGDTAQILMESPLPAGDYLITVEREGIFTQELKHFDSSASVIDIPVSKNYVPVVYVSIATYSVRNGAPKHKYGEVDVDKPKGYYGVVPLFVNTDVKAFSIQIETDKPTYRPGEDVEVTLTATKAGVPFKNAELTLMAVDRGVLDLIDYHVSNPIDFFYNIYNYPLYVFGGDSRYLIMDPVIYSARSLAGGDADEPDEEKEEKRKDFRPTAVFEPVLMTDENGKAVCHFKMPDNLTTYRITAFGVSNDLFALQEDEVKVQNPVNVSVVKPRKLRERDTAEFGVLLTNLDKDGHNITVSVEVEPAQAVTDSEDEELGDGMNVVPGAASIDGVKEHTVYVASNDSSVVYFDIAAEQMGTVVLKFHIQSDILAERIEDTLEIERTYVYETVASMATISSSANSGGEQIILPGFAKDGRGDLKVTLDATRLGLLGGGVDYLFRYPYGCLEQQSSRLLPLVLFEDYIDVFGLESEVTNPKKVVRKFMKDIAKAQHDDGGFPYWPDGNYSNYYVSLRIAQIYQAGIERGYKKSDLAIKYDSLLNYLSNNMYRLSDSMKAQAAYVLVKAGRTSADSVLAELYRNRDNLAISTMAYVGLAYQEKGDTEKTKACKVWLNQYLVPGTRTVSITNKSSNNGYYFWENESTNLALILKFFSNVNPEDEMVDRLIYTLMENQTHGYWCNTCTTAAVLDGIYTYIQQRNLDDTNFRGRATLDGKEIVSESFKGVAAKPKTVELPFEGELLASLPRDKALELKFTKNGTGYLNYTTVMTYALPDEMQAARDEGIKVTYEIRDYDTEELINPSDLKTNELTLTSGKLYRASVTVQCNKSVDYVALRAPIPSGAEILDSTFVTSGDAAEITTESSTRWGHWLSNKVIHDNEIQFFWDDFSAGSATVNYTFRAVRRGVYPVPPVQAECMYEPEVFGRGDGYLVEIR